MKAGPQTVGVAFIKRTAAYVDDLVQRTFLACLEAGDRLDDVRSFGAYLFGIARHELIQHLRRRGRGPEDSVDDLRDGGGSPSRVAAEKEEERLLLRALRRLPVDLQIAIELYAPLSGGLSIGGRFAPAKMKVPAKGDPKK